MALFSASAAAQTPLEMYQRALVQERAAGNLQSAIDLYERVAKDAGRNRALAAKSLIHAAECYQKLGQPKAAELYSQVVRVYPEQRESVLAAQAALLTVTRAKAQLPSRLSADLQSEVVPMLNNYCVRCHSQSQKMGGFAIDDAIAHLTANAQGLSQDAEVWEKVIVRLQSKSMPPAGQPRPIASANASAISLLEGGLDIGYPQPLLAADRVSDSELAARMARLIWGTGPDATLLDLVRRGHLSDSAVIDQQVTRMIADPRSAYLVSSFFESWLHIPDVTWSPLGPNSPPELDSELQQSFLRETQMFLENQLQENHSATDLWTANYTFLNERLARHYGISNVSGSQFRRVNYPDDRRAGLLGQGSVLTLTSLYSPSTMRARTSPTLRGRWLLITFLGFNPPPPPPSLQPLESDGRPDAPIRERLESATSPRACINCHRYFDPLGFALGNFDSIGRWRDVDGGEPVDASGLFLDGTPWKNVADFRRALLQYRDAYLTSTTNVMLSFALGRAARPSDGRVIPSRMLHSSEMPAVRVILRDAKAPNYAWASIIAGIVKSRPFQMKNIVP